MEKIAIGLGIGFSFAFALLAMAWVTFLPVIGALHLLGMLK